MKKFLLFFLLFSFFCVYSFQHQLYSSGKLEKSVAIVIPKGSSSTLVAQKLEEAGVISSPLTFKLYARFIGLHKKLRAGEYLFEPKISLAEALNKIVAGDVVYRKVTFAEGLTTSQILAQLEKISELSGDISIDVKEGELLPETYSFEFGDTKDSVIMQAKKAMQKTIDEAWDNRDRSLMLKDKNQLLILASIVEKETGIPEEREVVASVFSNRLVKGMKLQTDPTVIYALTQGKKDLGRSLKRKDLKIDSPYNTYKYYGLPPTPICNPGKEAIWAAAQPADTDYLYFVATGDGGHNFSKSLSEHNKNVKNWVKKISK